MTASITFAHPLVFWALAVLPLLAAFFIIAEQSRRIAINRLLAVRLQPRLAGTVSTVRRRVGFALLLLGLALCLIALAGPRWGVTLEEQVTRGRDLIIAIDTSRSMLAQDVAPSRLERAKFAALDLVGETGGDRLGLIAFAGQAFLQAPLTPDHDAVAETIRSLDTENIGQGGSDLASAIEAAAEAFGKGESTQRALVLFSDGEELQADVLVAAEKYKDQFRIYTIGVGTEAGAPVIRPTAYGGEYIRDPSGAVVTTKLDETRLREVAKIAGGFYLHLQNGPADMRHLAQMGLDSMSQKESETRTKEVPNERFQWPLLAGLVCLATGLLLGERRRLARTAATAAASLWLCCTPTAQASSGLWQHLDHLFDSEAPPSTTQDSMKELERVEAQKSRRPAVPEIDYNLGCAAYSSGDYDRAVAAFSTALSAASPELKEKAAYNLANALARRGVKREKEPKLSDWNNAVKQYDQVLALDPSHVKAKENRDAVQKAIDELNKKEQEQKKDDQKKPDKKDQPKDKKDQKDQKDKNKDQKKDDKGQQDKDQQSKDQQSKDGKEPKDQEGKEGKEGKEGDSKEEQGQNGEKKDGDPKDGPPKKGKDEGDQDKPKPGDLKNQEGKPEDAQQASQPKEGDLKDARQPKDKGQPAGQPGQPGDDKGENEAAEAAQAAKEGRMTEKDARALIDAARKREQILPPLQQLMEGRRQRTPNGKDW